MQALEQTSPTKVTIKRKKRTYVKKNDVKKPTKVSEETSILKDMIDYDEIAKLKDTDINKNATDVLGHIGTYIEEPYNIIESYFKGKHLDRLVRHQLESYNHFVTYQIQRTIDMFNPVVIRSENDYIPEINKYLLEIHVNFSNFQLYSPQIH